MPAVAPVAPVGADPPVVDPVPPTSPPGDESTGDRVRPSTYPLADLSFAQPVIHPLASVHPFANVVGNVGVGAGARIGPGTSVRADRGTAFWLGMGSQVEDGALIHGVRGGTVLGDDGQDYAVWLGDRATVSHLALVHGPAYIGRDCFLGFRSTVFNARVGEGSIVMMHVLIQDVEVPPGRFVPSGSTILTQEQADALPVVRPSDREFIRQLSGLDETPPPGRTDISPLAGYPSVGSKSAGSEVRLPKVAKKAGSNRNGHSDKTTNKTNTTYATNYATKGSGGSVVTTSLSADLVQQVRQLLAQGYQVSAEYADTRRFQTSSWQSCSLPRSAYESDILAAIETCLRDRQGFYVRLIGIDPAVKKRVYEAVIQRPADKAGAGQFSPAAVAGGRKASVAGSHNNGYAPATAIGGLSPETVQQVRQLLAQGYRIGTEHADARRFRVSSWTSCAPIESTHESQVVSALQGCIKDHAGEYVRLLGIDPATKRRVYEATIQRPDGPVAATGGVKSGVQPTSGVISAAAGSAPAGGLSGDVVSKIRQLTAQGCRITAEYADPRRFQVASWQTCADVRATSEREAIAALSTCMAARPGDYVRLVAVEIKTKRRVAEIIVQRPGQAAATTAPGASPSGGYSPAPTAAASGSKKIAGDVVQQLQSLVNQGYRVGAEYADPRRFRVASWTSCGAIESSNVGTAIAALESCLSSHPRDYVRVVGIDPKAKKRVYEAIIQRP